MTRKEFLRNFATLGIASPFIASLLASCNKETSFFEDFDVNFDGKILVIGAGAAGITAGHILNKQGIDFQILEASSIHGGRVKKSSDFVDFPIDLGGEWIHTDPSILAKLYNEPQSDVDIDIIVYNPQTVSVWKNGELKKRNIASNFYSEHKFKSSTWFDFFDSLMVPNIQDRIVYNSPVSNIDYSGDKVIVTANNQTYEADKVLITVPVSILQSNYINFTPGFSSQRQNALDEMYMPDGLKVFIEFSEKFYPDIVMFDDLLQAAINSDHTYYNAAFRKDTDRNVFALFTVGDPARRYTSLPSEEAIFQKVMEELDEMFDGQASQYYVKHIIQNWTTEPFIQGSYNYGGGGNAIDILGEPIDNKIFFAGEAFAENSATVHGAAESAYVSVERMLVS